MKTMKELVQDLIAAPSCCAEAKAAAQAYLDAGAEAKPQAAAALIAELQADVNTVDDVIAFFASEMGTQVFGAEKAAALLAGAKAHKAAGGLYCNCPACDAGAAILARKAEL